MKNIVFSITLLLLVTTVNVFSQNGTSNIPKEKLSLLRTITFKEIFTNLKLGDFNLGLDKGADAVFEVFSSDDESPKKKIKEK